jgi:hypothetical protein
MAKSSEVVQIGGFGGGMRGELKLCQLFYFWGHLASTSPFERSKGSFMLEDLACLPSIPL